MTSNLPRLTHIPRTEDQSLFNCWRQGGSFGGVLLSTIQAAVRNSLSSIKNGTARCAQVSLSAGLVLLAGCATPNYALKPEPVGSQSFSPFRGGEVVQSTGNSAIVAVFADVSDVLKSRYVVVTLAISNSCSSTLDLTWSCLDLLCCSPKGEQRLAPLEPEALIAKLSKERASRQASRGWGTLFLALASSRHGGTYSGVASDGTSYRGSYSYNDYGPDGPDSERRNGRQPITVAERVPDDPGV